MRLDNKDSEASEGSDIDDLGEGRRSRRKASFHQCDEQEGKQLEDHDRARFEEYLEHKLKSSRKSICDGMVFAIEHAPNSNSVTNMICDKLISIGSGQSQVTAGDLEKIKAVLYLISDILFNSAKITAAWSYNRHFELKMPTIMNEMNAKIRLINGRLS